VTSPLEIARDAALERFSAWLRDHNQPATPQRLAIARVILGADAPLAAEAVVERLRAQGPAPGVATVYRTIDVLIACGLIAEEDRHEGFRRFRAVRDDVSVEELLCTSCGGVTAVSVGAAPAVADVTRAAGFVAVRHRLTVYGVCAECAATRTSSSNTTNARGR
jgi:Fur family ferric uptake transcriptional regulator